jgi:hypothetical protein
VVPTRGPVGVVVVAGPDEAYRDACIELRGVDVEAPLRGPAGVVDVVGFAAADGAW